MKIMGGNKKKVTTQRKKWKEKGVQERERERKLGKTDEAEVRQAVRREGEP